MTTKPKNELSPKHLQALDLIRSGEYSYREVAAKVGWSEQYLYNLIAGDANTGSSAVLFAAEVDKITADMAKDIKHLSKKTQKNIFSVFEEWSQTLKTDVKVSPERLSTAVSIMNAIGKVTPKVEIGSFTYMKGLSAEDLFNEFRRLKDSAIDRRGIQGLDPGRTGTLPESEEPGSPS